MKGWLVAFVFLARVASAQSHADVVMQMYAEAPPPHTLEGAADFTVRLVRRLNVLYPAEGAMVLEKVPPGEGIAEFAGTTISAARVCYPGNRLFKVLTDVPTTNGPQWADDGVASIGGFLKGCISVSAQPPPPPPPPAEKPPAQTGDLAPLMARVIGLETQIEALSQQLQSQTDAIREDIKSFRDRAMGLVKELAKYVTPAVLAWLAKGAVK